MPNNENRARLPRPRPALFTRGARTSIIVLVSVCLVSFVLIPLFLSRSEGANAIYVATGVRYVATPTPVPQSLYIDEPDAEPSVSPDPTNEVQISQYSLLQENDDYPAVENLQVRLMELGYLDSDEPTTHFGSATTVAVSLVQRTMSANMDGIATSDLQEYLFSDEVLPYEIKLGDSGPDVESMQERLTELGYYTDKINGYFGVATESALQDFEVKNKLDVDGAFSVADRDLLYSPSARPKIDPTPTPAPTPKRTPAPTPKPSKTNSGSGASAGSTPGAGAPPGGSGSTKTDPPVTDPPDSGASSGGSYSASYSAEGIISVANAMKGVRYSWSEESPEKGFDCSGLVYYCLRTCGVSTSRYSAAGFSQVSSWSHIDSISGLSRGDLVFFRNDTSSKVSHTGIYLGGGSFIHASASSGKVIVSSIDTSYWTRNFVCGRRIF